MKKETKGVLAAGLGGLLLIGGGSTLASWTAQTDPDGGGAINSGRLGLVTDLVNDGCGEWVLEGATGFLAGDPLVPGDVLRLDCAFTVEAVGTNLAATVELDAPVFSGADGDFAGNLDVDVTSLTVGGAPASTITDADDGEPLVASIEVTFSESALNGTMDLSTVLDDLTLTATQIPA